MACGGLLPCSKVHTTCPASNSWSSTTLANSTCCHAGQPASIGDKLRKRCSMTSCCRVLSFGRQDAAVITSIREWPACFTCLNATNALGIVRSESRFRPGLVHVSDVRSVLSCPALHSLFARSIPKSYQVFYVQVKGQEPRHRQLHAQLQTSTGEANVKR